MDAHESSEPRVFPTPGTVADRVGSTLRAMPPLERHLWALVCVVFLADVHLTWIGLQQGLQEGNPVMAWAIGVFGILALVLAKTLVLCLAGAIRSWRPRYGSTIALGLALPTLAVVVVNAAQLL